KHINDANGQFRSVAVLKAGKKAEEGQEQVDAWAGATITSTGVNDMLFNSLSEYAEFLGQTKKCCSHNMNCNGETACPKDSVQLNEEMEVENAE
ncbi:MAG: FMN-binding protein, partial [Paludibacteraceae bacterium]|nr:FMN-binding protein [Paludibacteraceae bacterium]